MWEYEFVLCHLVPVSGFEATLFSSILAMYAGFYVDSFRLALLDSKHFLCRYSLGLPNECFATMGKESIGILGVSADFSNVTLRSRVWGYGGERTKGLENSRFFCTIFNSSDLQWSRVDFRVYTMPRLLRSRNKFIWKQRSRGYLAIVFSLSMNAQTGLRPSWTGESHYAS